MAVIPMEIDDQAMNQIKATFLQSAQEAFKAVSKRQTFGRYMNIKTASKYANVAENTFKKKFINVGLKVIDLDGLQRIDKQDLDKFMDENKI